MFNDSSFSVRTPSYQPNIRLYYRLNNDLPAYRYLELNVFHHSNGQDQPSLINGEWNTYNGNFSTNFIRLGYNWGHHDLGDMRHAGIFLQQHFGIPGALEQDGNLDGVYGQTRLQVEYLYRVISRISYPDPVTNTEGFALYKEKFRFYPSLSYILAGLKDVGAFDVSRRLNMELSSYYSFKSWKRAALFLTLGYYGEDPYNIYFNQNYGFVRFGIATGHMFLRVDPEYAGK